MQQKSIFNTTYITCEIMVGNVGIGKQNPIRIQSMTSTNTNDIEGTTAQSIRMIEAGCELVRITVPSLKEVDALKKIQKEIRSKGYNTPLIADVHYQPKVAEEVAHFIEKVRINPGNYVDRNSLSKTDYSDKEYQEELNKIADRLAPLLNICKANGTAIRIGTNHGSLSQRITSRYGDTPKGMVASAMEFVKICEAFQFHNIILSMKSSNLKVMVQAYRLLANTMLQEGMNYPLHLGVTEAGNGMEGRIKSAAGIGTLLEEGIGDTIRVSLTEDPEFEVPVANSIIKKYNPLRKEEKKNLSFYPHINPFEYNKRKTETVGKFGGNQAPQVIGSIGADVSIRELQNLPVMNVRENLKSQFNQLIADKNLYPVILRGDYNNIDDDDFILKAAIDFGSLQIDGLGDGILIENKSYKGDLVDLSKKILQACGTRITATEYIACPSCGRTQYNIQEALEKVKEATNHLAGLKIAVMGCVVNGPGEMADAHYGYIGAGKGKVNIYKGRTLIKKGIPEDEAIEELIKLIKDNGDWKEKTD